MFGCLCVSVWCVLHLCVRECVCSCACDCMAAHGRVFVYLVDCVLCCVYDWLGVCVYACVCLYVRVWVCVCVLVLVCVRV